MSLTFLLSCNSSREKELMIKENELLKRELEIQKRESLLTNSQKVQKNLNDTNDKVKSLKTLLNKDWEIVKVNNRGDFSFDMGSASAGRVSGNLNEVIISIEHKPERPGCADICPPMKIIYFECKNGGKCVTDPADPEIYGYFKKGSISFGNLLNGEKTYELLFEIQKAIKVQ